MLIHKLYPLIIGFTAGVAASSFFSLDFWFAAFILFLGGMFLLISLRLSQSRSCFLFLSILFLGVSLGILRYEIKDYRNYWLESFVGKKISFEGVVNDEPDERENYTRLVVTLTEMTPPSFSARSENKILIYSPIYPKFKYGDLISINGKLQKPKKFTDSDNGRDFNWSEYLAKDDIYYEIFYPKIEFISEGNGNWLKSKLFAVKEKFLDNLAIIIPEPAASFLGGITVGAKKSIPKDLQKDFITTGIIHIVVLSGYNITIIAKSIMSFFEIFAPRFIAAIFGGLGIILFAIMTGGSATAVRASIMAILIILAKQTGRVYHITLALIAAGFLMILHNPKILRFDASFQLSFLATLGLIYLAPKWEKIFKLSVKQKTLSKTDIGFLFGIWIKIRETLAATLSAQLAVTPLLLYTMGNFSIVVLPVNLLILLFIPATMFFGFAAGIAGFFSHIISIPFAWISYGFLAYELWLVKIFSRLPFASIQIPYFPAFAAILIYGIIAAVLFISKKKNKN